MIMLRDREIPMLVFFLRRMLMLMLILILMVITMRCAVNYLYRGKWVDEANAGSLLASRCVSEFRST